MANLNRQLRRENNKPTKTLIGVYGQHNPMTLLVDGDILLVFDDENDLRTFLASAPRFPFPNQIKLMYFEDMMQGFSMGGKYGMRRPVAQKFLVAWAKKYKDKPPFNLDDIPENVDFISLTAN
jgi:hypothetical protein